MSGWCEYCRMWHSADCYHPSRIKQMDRDAKIDRLLQEVIKLQEIVKNYERITQHWNELFDKLFYKYMEKVKT